MIRILAFIICMLPFTASASVMTFKDVAFGSGYAEDGITTNAGDRTFYTHPSDNGGYMWLVDRGTRYSRSVEFTMDGLFNAQSFDYFSTKISYKKCPIQRGDCTPLTYDNVKITGERNGVEIASTAFEMNDAPTVYDFGNTFDNIDLLRITLLTPYLTIFPNGHPVPDNIDVYRYFCNPECSQFRIDNVTLSAVPLPAAFPLFGAVLFGFGVWRAKFKKA